MAGRFFRDNAFLAAAVLLPVVVIGVFLLFTTIPQWTVAPPQYDLLLHTTDYDQINRRVNVELFVRDDRLQATLRPSLQNINPPRLRLWRFDHDTLSLREIQLGLPDDIPASESSTVTVDAMRGQRIVTDTRAPDGYEVRTETHRGPGLVGDLFGMRRYDQNIAIVNRGRMIPIKVPTPNVYQTPVFLGWIVEMGR